MRYLIGMFFMFFGQWFFGQNIILNKVVQTGNFTDKFFYKINPDSTQAVYLGELEVQGYSENDEKVFDAIYKKAKSIGANAFSYKPFESLEGKNRKLDPHHYTLNLYEVQELALKDQSNLLFIFSSASKPQYITVNTEKIALLPRSFYTLKLIEGGIYTISTRKLLGSTVKVQLNKEEGPQYFTVSSFNVKSNQDGNGGLNIKSGDITKLEKSYGDFLSTIYTKIK